MSGTVMEIEENDTQTVESLKSEDDWVVYDLKDVNAPSEMHHATGDRKYLEETIEHQKHLINQHEQEIERLKGFEINHPLLLENIKSLEGLHQAQSDQKRDLENRLEKSISSQRNLENDLRESKKDTRCLSEKNASLKKVNLSLEEEKNTLLLRLSKMAGAKLTYDNPNIADLSDKKRPTKLAEEFAELYDNEWTDAFENVSSDIDEKKTAILLRLLQRANELCREVSFDHIKRIKESLCTLTVRCNSALKRQSPGQDNDNTNIKRLRRNKHYPSELACSQDTSAAAGNFYDSVAEKDHSMKVLEVPSFDYDSLQLDQKKTVMELKKIIEFGLVNDLVKMVTDKITDEFSIDRDTQGPLLTYISICVQICWSMCQVEPSVFIAFPEEQGDICFDTAIYKPYTKSGKFVDFVVWPAVHLHENGPLLCKGVAQGKK